MRYIADNLTDDESRFWEEFTLPINLIEDERAFHLRLYMMIWIATSLAIGVPGNILMICSILCFKHLRQIPHILVVNLGLFDLGAMSMNVFALLGAIYGDTMLPKHPTLCEISGIICMLSCFGSLWTMMFIAMNRYLFICKNSLYTQYCDLKGTLITVVAIWLCVTLLDAPNFKFVGLGGHAFITLNLHCSFRLDNTWWFNTILYSGLALTVPLIVISFCYFKIWTKTTKSLKVTKTVSKKRARDQRQLLVSLITIFLTFVVTWMPYGTIILFTGIKNSFVHSIPFELYLFCDLWAHTNASVNFIIFGFTHSGFKRAYKMWLKKFVPCLKGAIDTSNSVVSRHQENEATSSRAAEVRFRVEQANKEAKTIINTHNTN